ncbi:hypothetical protein ABIE52_000089 [Rhodococcus sp. OAS809]
MVNVVLLLVILGAGLVAVMCVDFPWFRFSCVVNVGGTLAMHV